MSHPFRRLSMVFACWALGVLGTPLAKAAPSGAGFVQWSAASADGGSLTLSLPGPTVRGHSVVLGVASWGVKCDVTDSAASTYKEAAPWLVGPSGMNPMGIETWYVSSVDAGPRPLEVTVANCSKPEVLILEYAGLGAFDVSAVGKGPSTSPIETGIANTKFPHELLVGFVRSEGSSADAGPGFTARAAFPHDLVEEAEVFGDAGYSATALSNGGVWVAQMATFAIKAIVDAGPVDAGADDGTVGAGIRYAQSAAGFADLSPLLVSLPFPSQRGSTIVVCLGAYAANCSVTDRAGNSYQAAFGPDSGQVPLDGGYLSIAYSRNIDAGSDPIVVTVDCVPAATVWGTALEYEGLDQGSPLDTAAGNSFSTASPGNVSLTTGEANELLVACIGSIDDAPVPSGTLSVRRRLEAAFVADRLAPDSGMYSVAATSDAGWTLAAAAFKAAASDAGPADAGPNDAGPGDGGQGDAGPGDGGSVDAGQGDAGSGDAGLIDAGDADGGTTAPGEAGASPGPGGSPNLEYQAASCGCAQSGAGGLLLLLLLVPLWPRRAARFACLGGRREMASAR